MKEDKNTIRILFKICNTGLDQSRNLKKELEEKDNKIKGTVEEIFEEYDSFMKAIKKLIKKYKADEEENSLFMKAMGNVNLKFELIKDNSDSKVADMLIKGFTLGTLELTKLHDNHEKEVSKDVKNILKKCLEFHRKYIDKLKVYL